MQIEEYLTSSDKDLIQIGFTLLNQSDLSIKEKVSLLYDCGHRERQDGRYFVNGPIKKFYSLTVESGDLEFLPYFPPEIGVFSQRLAPMVNDLTRNLEIIRARNGNNF